MENKIRLAHCVWIILGYIAFYMLCLFIGATVMAESGPGTDGRHGSMAMVASVLPCIVIVYLSRYYLKDLFFLDSPKGLAVRGVSPRDVLQLLASSILLAVLVIVVSPYFYHEGGVPTYAQGTSLYIWIITSVLVAPVAEEFIFRGLIFSVAYPRIGMVSAVMLSNVLFILIHLPSVGLRVGALLSIAILGFAATYYRLRMNSLIASILFHAFYNLTISSYILWMH